jgi:hypothetical protein
MWILPKQLHTSAFVPDTEALISDSSEQSQICGQSLLVRSKPSPARTWSLKWKRDSWTQHLYGRILKPSLGKTFVTAWTSSLGDTHVSPSAQQESDKDQKTHATSGPISQMELFGCDPESASLKTSKDISAWDCPTLSKTWQEWVTERRLEYSARVKSARLTNASGSLSWPTVQASEEKANRYRDGSAKGTQIWLTTAVIKHGQADPANPSTDGSRQESWRTPSSSDGEGGVMEMRKNCAGKYKLRDHVHAAWATPQTRDGHNHSNPSGLKRNSPDLCRQMPLGAKLNPRWVETLMGLSIGWCMPSCTQPATIAQTNSACSEMG